MFHKIVRSNAFYVKNSDQVITFTCVGKSDIQQNPKFLFDIYLIYFIYLIYLIYLSPGKYTCL